jgi:hypothetical protein
MARGNGRRHHFSSARQAPAALSGLFRIPRVVSEPPRQANTGQVRGLPEGDIARQVAFISILFGIPTPA